MSEREYLGIRLDAQAVKVLAHPLRSRLLSRLRTAGPATATGLAAALNTNTGATSYHLRKLETVGLVTDTGEGEGKRRLWRASTDFHSWTNSGVPRRRGRGDGAGVAAAGLHPPARREGRALARRRPEPGRSSGSTRSG